jgi:hypothetical protein
MQVYVFTRLATLICVLINLVGYNVRKEIKCRVSMIPLMVKLYMCSSTIHEQLWLGLELVSRSELHVSLRVDF